MKTWLRFSPNLFSNLLQGTALFAGLCLPFSAFPQSSPLATPPSTKYPGVIESFEKIIQIDNERFEKKINALIKAGKLLTDLQGASNIDLDPDFLNSVILHSAPGYLKLASREKCRLYDTTITDLLRSAEGKIKNVIVRFIDKNGQPDTAVMARKDFLTKVVTSECPQTNTLIAQFQVKNIDEVLRGTDFTMPTGDAQCRAIISRWLSDPKTPFLCQLHEYMDEAMSGGGDPQDLAQRRAVAKILDSKININQKDYLQNLCKNLDDEEHFCGEFLNVSFWNKVANGTENKIYAEDICRASFKGDILSEVELKACLSRMKKESDLCLYPRSGANGLLPQMECDAQSTALNHSTLRADYQDCPGKSDQHAVTNMTRILFHVSQGKIAPYEGPCSSVSSGEFFSFNQRFDNEDKWDLEACFNDKILEREVCMKTLMGNYGGLSQSYTNVVAEILKKTRGADRNLTCKMISSTEYSPFLLQYKSGCFIIYEADQCYISHCPHKIVFNDRPIDLIKLRNSVTVDYFATNLQNERFAQHYLLSTDLKLNGRSMNNLSTIISFFSKTKKGVLHGVACAEYLLPTFFPVRAINQCTPVPLIVDGLIREGENTVLITRTAYDSLQAPRMVSWSNLYTSIKEYQRVHPLRLWTLHALD